MTATPSGRLGRPTRKAASEIDNHILAIADRAFSANGYDGTSMASIATSARIGKQTLYRRYPDKALLFRAVAHRRIDQLAATPDIAVSLDDPVSELKRLVRAALDGALDPEVIMIHQVLIAEVSRFPDLANDAGKWGEALFERAEDALRRIGLGCEPRLDDCRSVATSLVWGVVGEPFYRALMGGQVLNDKKARDEYFEQRWSSLSVVSTLGLGRGAS